MSLTEACIPRNRSRSAVQARLSIKHGEPKDPKRFQTYGLPSNLPSCAPSRHSSGFRHRLTRPSLASVAHGVGISCELSRRVSARGSLAKNQFCAQTNAKPRGLRTRFSVVSPWQYARIPRCPTRGRLPPCAHPLPSQHEPTPRRENKHVSENQVGIHNAFGAPP